MKLIFYLRREDNIIIFVVKKIEIYHIKFYLTTGFEMQKLEFIAFDTETTGLWAPAHRIVEIGAVKFNLENNSKETFQHLINPERKIPSNVIKIHGITDEEVSSAEIAKPVLEKFIQFCGKDSILIAHNAPFDISFVSCELDRSELAFNNNLILDNIDIFKKLYPNCGSYALLSLSQKFKIADGQNHRALEDAELVRLLFLKAFEGFDETINVEYFSNNFPIYNMNDWHQITEEIPDGFNKLLDAKNSKTKIRIFYARQGETTHLRDVWPKQFYIIKDRYYMRAYCERAKNERTFRLDRIKDFETVEN
ncbi:MAG: exonuclease domain-containing protein [candidate division Zixibacteria bacterium]|nr:exonuclease domain-containing protein [candidate division Zixibacteria bacterium]